MFPWLKDTWLKLRELLVGRRPPHAVILHGGDGLGKKEIALELGRLFLCENTSISGYCGACHSCRLSLSGNHPDYYHISSPPRTKIGIDAIRDIIASVSVTPKLGVGKAVIIENAEMLTVEAANALLKVLEEPQGRTMFILTADSVNALLPTIRSRCVSFRIPCPPFRNVKEWIYGQLSGRHVSVTEEIYRINHQSPVDTVRFINNGYDELFNRLTLAFAQIMQEPARVSQLVDLMAEISVKIQTDEAQRSENPVPEKSAKKPNYKLQIADVYFWIYYILADILRYRVTGSFSSNLILKNAAMLAFFEHISVECLDRSINRLTGMVQREKSMTNSYAAVELSAFFNELIKG
jgi:DNA polymerase-3 subunit delta'